ncbi:hypothetical protein AgCh_007216 [Apium graveolens]
MFPLPTTRSKPLLLIISSAPTYKPTQATSFHSLTPGRSLLLLQVGSDKTIYHYIRIMISWYCDIMDFFSDRIWMTRRKSNTEIDATAEFRAGCGVFLDYAYSHPKYLNEKNQIRCPCKTNNYLDRDMVNYHLLVNGFMRNYEECWWAHGQKRDGSFTSNYSGSSITYHMDEMVHDIAGQDFDWEQTREQPMNSDAKAFTKLLEEGREPLWYGCTKHTKLSAVATLLNIKADHNISHECFESLLKAIKSMLPDNEKLSDNYYYCKKMVKKLGLGYQKIDACPNDYMLFYKENEKITKCTVCGHDRFKPNKDGVILKKINYTIQNSKVFSNNRSA